MMDAAGSSALAAAASASESAAPLTDREREILAFERQWWRQPGAKERAVKEQFGVSAIRYYQLLNALLDKPEALAVDPALVRRLDKIRNDRFRARVTRRLGVDRI